MSGIPIDLKTVLDEFDNDKVFLHELLNDLVVQVKDQIKTIRDGIQSKSCEKVWREAHTIKGGASNVTANMIADIALQIERAGKNGDLLLCNDLLCQLEIEVKNLEEYIGTM